MGGGERVSQGGEPRDRAVFINPLQEVEQSVTPQQNNMARAFAQDIIGVDTAEATYSAYFVKKDTKTSQGTSGESADYEGNRAVFSDSGDGEGAFEKFFQATDEDGSTVTYTPKGIWVKQQKTDGGRVFEPATPAIIKPTKERSETRKSKDKTLLVVPDMQLGYRRIDGGLTPLYDLHVHSSTITIGPFGFV